MYVNIRKKMTWMVMGLDFTIERIYKKTGLKKGGKGDTGMFENEGHDVFGRWLDHIFHWLLWSYRKEDFK